MPSSAASAPESKIHSCASNCGAHNGPVSGQLELRQGVRGFCHYLEGFPVDEGTPLEVLLADGTWLAGVYSWSGVSARWPGLRFELGGVPQQTTDGIRRPMAVMALPPQAQLRRLSDIQHVAAADKH